MSLAKKLASVLASMRDDGKPASERYTRLPDPVEPDWVTIPHAYTIDVRSTPGLGRGEARDIDRARAAFHRLRAWVVLK